LIVRGLIVQKDTSAKEHIVMKETFGDVLTFITSLWWRKVKLSIADTLWPLASITLLTKRMSHLIGRRNQGNS
jgi:hypothetical protein